MMPHLEALRTALAPLNVPVHLFDASRHDGPLPPVPYLVLASPSWGQPDEMPICDESDDLDADVRVTGAATTPGGAVDLLGDVRALLSPRFSWTPLPMATRRAQTKFVRSEFVGIDRDVTLPATGRHPGYGVDTYRLHSTPL